MINKYGASLLALVAQHFKVPFYVVADSTKWIQISRTEFILEEMPLAEINDPINAPTSSFIHTHNVYFDTSPLDTVTAHTSEYGIEEQ